MANKKYKASDLAEFIEEVSSIQCSNCGNEDSVWFDNGEDQFFKKGWRATKYSVYCPVCAKKKLKL